MTGSFGIYSRLGAVVLVALSMAGVPLAGRSADDASLLPHDRPTATIEISPTTRSIAAIRINDLDAVVALPANDAPPGTHMTVTARGATPNDFPTLSLTFDKDVTFRGYPCFRFEKPYDISVDRHFFVDFFDGAASTPLRSDRWADLPHSLTFIGGYFTPLHVHPHRVYQARVLEATAHTTEIRANPSAQSLLLPFAGGIAATLDVPPIRGGGSVTIQPLVEAPSPLAATAPQAPYYLNVVYSGTLHFSGPIVLTALLPLTAQFGARQYRLVAEDGVRPTALGPRSSAGPISDRLGDLVRFTLTSSELVAANGESHVLLALAASGEVTASVDPVTVAVLGSSVSELTVTPLNSPNCYAGDGPLHCQYSGDDTLSYPGVVANLTGARIVNLAIMDGSQTTVDSINRAGDQVKAWTSALVPKIPTDTDFVVFEGGITDLSYNDDDPTTSRRVPDIARAIKAQAPNAKIIFIGPRCCENGGAAWRAVEQDLAPQYGAFLDLRTFGGIGHTEQFPDGIHPSPEAARAIGQAISEVIGSVARTPRAMTGAQP